MNTTYDVHACREHSFTLNFSSNYKQLIAEGRVSRVENFNEKETHRIDLLQRDFRRATDIVCILNMGKKLEEKLEQLLDFRTMSSYIKLYSIVVDDKEANHKK